MDCEEFDRNAAELALGVLTGRARAEALAHVEECDACRETLRRLTLTGEDLVQLLPAAEPPPGFETRVLDRLGMPAGGRRGGPSGAPLGGTGGLVPPSRGFERGAKPPLGKKLLAAAAVTVGVLAAGLGGWGLRGLAAPRPAAVPLSSAALVPAGHPGGGHSRAGDVYYYAGHSRWMYMWVDLPAGGDSVVTCQVRGAGGGYRTVASFRLNGGYGSWGSPVPEVSGPVTGARLLGPGGRTLATARFLRPGLTPGSAGTSAGR